MARPIVYVKDRLFQLWANQHPENRIDPSSLDVEFDNIQTSLGQTRSVLNGITRDDGRIAQSIVSPESFDNASLALLRSGSCKPRGAWSATTLFNENDIASINGASYVCLIQHISTAAFDFDNNAGYWQLVANNALTGYPSTGDVFNGNGAQTDFVLSYSFGSPYSFLAFVNGMVRIPEVEFSLVSGNVIRFASAPPVGAGNVFVMASTAAASAGQASAFATTAQAAAIAADASADAAAASAADAAASVGLSPAANNTWTGYNQFFPSAAIQQIAEFKKNQNDISYIRVSNLNSGSATYAAYQCVTGTANSYINLAIFDNSGSPYAFLSSGIAISAVYVDFNSHIFRSQGGTERFRFGSLGQFGIGGANYGTAGQVMTSGGASAAPSWADIPAGVPAGNVAYFAMSSAPAGYLKANGAEVSRTTYAALDAAIGTLFGAYTNGSGGAGTTHFRLPDLRGEFIRSLADGRAVDTGRALGSAQVEAYLNHAHTASSATAGAHTHGLSSSYIDAGLVTYVNNFVMNMLGGALGTTGSAGDHAHTITVAASTTGGTETRPRNVALLACIKY